MKERRLMLVCFMLVTSIFVLTSFVFALPTGYNANDVVSNAFENGDFSDTTDLWNDNKGWTLSSGNAGLAAIANGKLLLSYDTSTGAAQIASQPTLLPADGDYAVCADISIKANSCDNQDSNCDNALLYLGSQFKNEDSLTTTPREVCFERNGISAVSASASVKPLIKIQSSGKSKIVADNVKLYRKGSGTVSPPPAGGLSCNILNNVIFLDKETGNFDVRFTTTGDAKRFRAVVANYVPGRTQNGVDASEIELCRLGPDKFDTKRYSLEAPVGVNSATSPQTWRCRWSNGVSAYDPQTDIVEGDYVATVIVYNTSS